MTQYDQHGRGKFHHQELLIGNNLYMSLFQLSSKDTKGFTVIELLVTISIIGILSTITFASFSQAQKKARIAKRVSDLKQMQVALEYYYAVNRAYPNSGGTWITECTEFNSTGNNVIPGLVPNYISKIPLDPKSAPTAGAARPFWQDCYLYISYNGSDYAFVNHSPSEFSQADYLSQPQLVDPARDGGSNASIVDGSGIWAWKVYSPGGITW